MLSTLDIKPKSDTTTLDLKPEPMLCRRSRKCVDGSLDVDTLVEFPIQPDEYNTHDSSPDHSEENSTAVDRHRDDIARRHPVFVHIRSVDTRGVGNGVDESKRGCTFSWRSRKRVANPSKSYDEGTVDSRDLF